MAATGNSRDEFTKEIQSLTNDIKPEWYENWYDGLGYCKQSAHLNFLDESNLALLFE